MNYRDQFTKNDINFIESLMLTMQQPSSVSIRRTIDNELFLVLDQNEYEVVLPLDEQSLQFIQPNYEYNLFVLSNYLEDAA